MSVSPARDIPEYLCDEHPSITHNGCMAKRTGGERVAEAFDRIVHTE